MAKLAIKNKNRLIKDSFDFQPVGKTELDVWIGLQRLAVMKVGANHIPHIIAAAHGSCVYLFPSSGYLTKADLANLSLPYGGLLALWAELGTLAEAWGIPYTDQINQMRSMLETRGNGKFEQHNRDEKLAFIDFSLTVFGALRSGQPLWFELNPNQKHTNNDIKIVDNYSERQNTVGSASSLNRRKGMDQADKKVEILPKAVESVIYDELKQILVAETHQFRQVLAERFVSSLNARIQGMPHETLEEKKEVARFVNAELEPLGLAVKEPKTGRPGKLRGMVNSGVKNGAFSIEVKIEGKQEYPTVSSTLPLLQLMNESPPQQEVSNFRELVKRSRRSSETQR